MYRLRLITEGKTDRSLIRSLLIRHEIENVHILEPKIEEQGGYTWLRQNLSLFLKATDTQRFGIVVDTDGNRAARWQSLRDRLRELGVPDIPDNCPENGWHSAKHGVWLVHGADGQGALEDLSLSLISPDDPVLPHARYAVTNAPEQLLTKKSKAVYGTWLAWQNAGAGMAEGVAKQSGKVNLDAPPAQAFVAWIKARLPE